ncbi:hypothetical protein PUNSTDRAFT_50601 [Punctularia strigosozonata HHB-11173 SS5]|uniref:uncharacterized protein n=1 Tax=Punctularia strigosozonata (strain HHB-11173) TaxID=741275 RepID=UPI000441683B|nr:uncharacterized protein PUNSTDRAFT_50601 [Punctularia strigosozonata HHB-11173 SS5]EIN11715.1 hypothetical protein PUNSTDRAFT_50601 [Punctularia strigosozonata HHB-11173 SS5]
MVAFNITGEDYSPLITYSPANAWNDSPSTNSLVSSSSAQSLHATTAQGATATISFTGTGIWLMGSKGPNYGGFTISVDGQNAQTGTAQQGTAAAGQLLVGVSGLSLGSHQAVLTSTGPALDLDSFIFETQVDGTTVSNSTVDDADSSISYGPSASDWSTNTGNGFLSNTLHFTQTGGATATYQFQGNAVALFGTVSPDHANYTISIDGQSQSYDGGSNTVAELRSQSLLYFAGNLGSQQHTLVLTANPDQAGQQNTGKFMDLDAITVWTGTGTDSTASPTPSSSNNGSSAGDSGHGGSSANDTSGSQTAHGHSSKGNMGLIIGASVGGAIFVLLVLLGLFFFLRRRKASKKLPLPPMTPALPLQGGPGMAEAGFGRVTNPGSPYANNEKLAPFVRPNPVPTFSAPVPNAPAPPVKDFSSHYEILNKSLTDLSAASHGRSLSLESMESRASENSRFGLLHKASLSKLKRAATAQAQEPPIPRIGSPPVRSKRTAKGANEPYGMGRSLTSGAPSRPSTRPPSLALSTVSGKPSAANLMPPRPSRPSSPHLSAIDQPVDPRGPARPSRPSSLELMPMEWTSEFAK